VPHFNLRAALLSAVAAVFACGKPPPETMPSTNAPRVVVPVANLEALRESAPWLQRWADTNSPFWRPTTEQVQSCEIAAWRAFWSERRGQRFHESAAQFAGITQNGKPRVLVHSVCGQLQSLERRRNPDLEHLVFPWSHTCNCFMSAVCDPANQHVSQVVTREASCFR
jgi:hypothetical protein